MGARAGEPAAKPALAAEQRPAVGRSRTPSDRWKGF
jgi:hypothetical protein